MVLLSSAAEEAAECRPPCYINEKTKTYFYVFHQKTIEKVFHPA